MYLFEFCYYGNWLMLFYLMFASKNQALFMVIYIFSNGTIAAGCVAFRASLVFHQLDFLMTLAMHAVPMMVTLHIRWETIPFQAGLPTD